jgi:endonuclease/exonuclease/phosphatase (EEP) superfamily protein YafD
MSMIIAVRSLKYGLAMGLRLFWSGLWALGLFLLLWYPLRWWPGDRFQPVRLLNYFMPWLMAGLVPGLLAATLARRIRLAVTLAVPTILIGLNFAPLFLPRQNYALASNTTFRVMSYNVLYRNQDLGAILSIVRQEKPDILLLQEVTPTIARALQTLSAENLDNEFHFAYDPQISQAIVSSYPLTALESAPAKGRTQKVLVHTPGGPISVWNSHIVVPAPWQRQYRQVTALVEDLASEQGPLILGGDFNTTYGSETYWLINQNLRNAHRQAGWGFGFTFPAHAPRLRGIPILTPVLRIDHIFHSSHFLASNAYTLKAAGGSDHLPVVAELVLTD